MKRLFRMSLLVAIFGILALSEGLAQKPQVFVSGRVAPGEVRVFLKDSVYVINRDYMIGGTLIIEPGTTVYFRPNGRLIDSTGGRIIADGDAAATYRANAGTGLNPLATNNSLYGYADPAYFLFPGVITRDTEMEKTIHSEKSNYVRNVILDTVNREIIDLVNPSDMSKYHLTLLDQNGNYRAVQDNPNYVVVPYELAIMWYAARLERNPEIDVNLNVRPWQRINDASDISYDEERIQFIGQPTNNFSREWGHIVILPGARAAFFRNVSFENFKKDVTVDEAPYYDAAPWLSATELAELNDKFNYLTNGSGGAITTFSSRTWLIDAIFNSNVARQRGGALQVLQAPVGYPMTDTTGLGSYPLDKNPAITDKDRTPSSIFEEVGIPRIDNLDEPFNDYPEPFDDIVSGGDFGRAAFDDARLAVYLGRFRNLQFTNNKVQLAKVGEVEFNGTDLVTDLVNEFEEPAPYPFPFGNTAYGGAIYISGDPEREYRRIEVGLGINNVINTAEGEVRLYDEGEYDTFLAHDNAAKNYQESRNSDGARGGAIYIGNFTSLIVAGSFKDNMTYARYFEESEHPDFPRDYSGIITASYSLGGAIYQMNNFGRLQVRGGPERVNLNETHFEGNRAGAGGALYIDGNTSPTESPIIGGSDEFLETRDWGFDIVFRDNHAVTYGGAIFTHRSNSINGAGGVEAEAMIGYGGKYPVKIHDNTAGFAGGGICVDIPNAIPPLPAEKRKVDIVRAEIINNTVGEKYYDNENYREEAGLVRGGGGLYTLNGDLNIIKGVEFRANTTYNGNGGAVAMIYPNTYSKRFFLSDLDQVTVDPSTGLALDFTSVDEAFTTGEADYPADVRMLTRFLDNEAMVDDFVLNKYSGSGATQNGSIVRRHPEINLPENGVGLGGALYILDSVSVYRAKTRVDSIRFNRVRIQDNRAYTGSALYSDNFNMKLFFNRSLITGNTAWSEVDQNAEGVSQNVITGPLKTDKNLASSDLAGATIYGEIQGPLPSTIFSEAANSIFDNDARFLIRLPDAPHSKGVLAGGLGEGFGGTDTLRGNYWGHTEANILWSIPNDHFDQGGFPVLNDEMETFWVMGDPDQSWMPYEFPATADPREQGPFESINSYPDYTPIPLINGATQYEVGPLSIPEHLLMSGHVYDLFDKGTDIKTADYSKRRMSPIEDFAVGIPPILRRFDQEGLPSYGKYVKRWIRDPKIVEMTDEDGDLVFPEIAALQTEFKPDMFGNFYHPIGYPLYLESHVNYDGLEERSNHDERMLNESVFFIINENTGDYIRANFKQEGEVAPYREVFRRTVELVPDSSNRIPNTLVRRTTEGLANFGSGKFLLEQLVQNAYNEDAGSLPGRKWDNGHRAFGKVSNLFSNRDNSGVNGMPDKNGANSNGTGQNTTFFGGERYNALPVDTGDVVRIVSRTVLWREGVIPAFDDGLAFRIVESTKPPLFTGDIPKLDSLVIEKIVPSEFPWKDFDTLRITDFADKIFVSEDREYPAPNGRYSNLSVYGGNSTTAGSQGRDSILNVTAIDTNRFYDPLHQSFPEDYSELEYGWSVDPNSGLAHWLQVDTIPFETAGNINSKDGARGYIQFKGRPANPFVVPGGEDVTVTARNFPPHWRVIDRMRENGLRQELIDQFVETFPPYMFASQYDVEGARFLQQDTIDYGKTYLREYSFKIFVTDSLPRFLEYQSTAETVPAYDGAPYQVEYSPTEYLCGVNRNGKIVANVTDKLRFQVDINTDDELEDAAFEGMWDYRYGRTAYGFANVVAYPVDGDLVIIDSVYYDEDEYTDGGSMLVQVRPKWMKSEYFYQGFEYSGNNNETIEFGEETADFQDEFLADLTTYGKINIRIPREDAIDLLTTRASESGFEYLVTDTLFALAVNDGHAGVAYKKFPVFINYKPEIITNEDNTLPFAVEGVDYNPQLLAPGRMIRVDDANVDQNHTFELVYEDDTRTEVRIDQCFPEAGVYSLDGLNTTPDWLKIDRESGKLYGTPSVTDAPANELVTVIVTDEDGLVDVHQFTLEVRAIANNGPEILGGAGIICIEENSDDDFITSVIVSDLDLLRAGETLTVEVLDASGTPINSITANPSTIQGPLTEETVEIELTGDLTDLDVTDGRTAIIVRVTDSYAESVNVINVDELYIRLQQSLDTYFTANVWVENVNQAVEVLEFGTAPGVEVSTGDGTDYPNEDRTGEIDNEYCEFELPPLPDEDTFDARWTVPSTNGILRNIYPDNDNSQGQSFIYKGTFQAGGVDGGSGALYPITLSWIPSQIPAIDDAERNPSGSSFYIRDPYSQGNVFSVNMRDPSSRRISSAVKVDWDGGMDDLCTITISQSVIDEFIIFFDYRTSVEDNAGLARTELQSVSPNPMTDMTNINFNVERNSNVRIEVVDVLGNVVNVLADGNYSAGTHSINWEGTNQNGQAVTSGNYNVRMVTDENTTTLPIVIVK